MHCRFHQKKRVEKYRVDKIYGSHFGAPSFLSSRVCPCITIIVCNIRVVLQERIEIPTTISWF